MKALFSALFGLLIGTSASGYAANVTQDDAVKLVNEIAAFLKTNGKGKTLAELNTKNGKFHKGNIYAFAYDLDGHVVAHPVNPKLIGKDVLNESDEAGKPFRKEIVDLAKSKGSGWVDYLYKNPTDGKVESRTTYLMRVGDIIIIASVYK